MTPEDVVAEALEGYGLGGDEVEQVSRQTVAALRFAGYLDEYEQAKGKFMVQPPLCRGYVPVDEPLFRKRVCEETK